MSPERDGTRQLMHTPLPPAPRAPQWYPEVNHLCKEVPIIVVGCKTDLRKDRSLVKKLRKNKLEPVTYHRVGNPARVHGAGKGTSGTC